MPQGVPLNVILPQVPANQSGLLGWAAGMVRAIANLYYLLALRLEQILSQNTTANRPTADGTNRVFFDTTKKVPYFDDGSWQGPHLEVIATADLPAAGAAQNGRVIIEDAGAGDRNIIIYVEGQRFRLDGGAAF